MGVASFKKATEGVKVKTKGDRLGTVHRALGAGIPYGRSRGPEAVRSLRRARPGGHKPVFMEMLGLKPGQPWATVATPAGDLTFGGFATLFPCGGSPGQIQVTAHLPSFFSWLGCDISDRSDKSL